jgi:hypothetical protein
MQLVAFLRLFFPAHLLVLLRLFCVWMVQAFCDYTHSFLPFTGLPQYLQPFFQYCGKISVFYRVTFVSDIQINTCSCYFKLKMYDKRDKTEARTLGYF